MAKKKLPSPEVLRQLLRYEPETGKLFWLPRTSKNCERPSWFNVRFAGQEAFTARLAKGHRVGLINRVTYQAHRVIWAIQTGNDPGPMDIDHIDRNPSNNVWGNLRLSTGSENQYNKRGKMFTSSKYKGVSASKYRKWVASIRVAGTPIHLGTFRCETSAAIAYDLAARKMHGQFALTNYMVAGNDT